MLLFETLSTLIVLGVMLVITWTMVRLMSSMTNAGLHFIPASWITTAWGLVASLSVSVFLLGILRTLFGV